MTKTSLFEEFWSWFSTNLWAPGVRVLTVIVGIGYVGAVWGAYSTIVHAAHDWLAKRHVLEVSYAIFTSLALIVGFAFYLLLQHTVRRQLAAARSSREAALHRSRLAERVAHVAAEEVRRVAGRVKPEPPSWDRLLGPVRDLLDRALGVPDTSITVKVLRDNQLVTIARVGSLHTERRGSLNETQSISSSYVYELFKLLDGEQQQVIVRDAHHLTATRDEYKVRAKLCGFRSVVAFPLRTPRITTGPGLRNQLLGFVSIDSPHPNAFDHWFNPAVWEGDHESQKAKPIEALEILYALADTIATIHLVLARWEDGEHSTAPTGQC